MTVIVNIYGYNYIENKSEVKAMDFTAYIQRQKTLIRNRHEGEVIYLDDGEEYLLATVESLLADLDNMQGLNKAERLCAQCR